ncbi:hypothetical protein C5167_010411 [Papaver somniferum]|uniref:Autophagy-related protein n=1 Tax=Papaver somniferum TaxID=3469 RepID=A0A4Y7K069_PAPSO|nr:hypothetical protein C5167_010411 [Papaver somniferum]
MDAGGGDAALMLSTVIQWTGSICSKHDQYNEADPEKITQVIVEKDERSEIPNIDRKKYLVPADLTVEQFVYVIRKRIKFSAEKAIFIFVDNFLPPTVRATKWKLFVLNLFSGAKDQLRDDVAFNSAN